MADLEFKVGDRVRYTMDSRTKGIPVQGTLGTVTAVRNTGTGTVYAITWDGGVPSTEPGWYATVLAPAP